MTRWQLALIAVLSLVSTAFVLTSGPGGGAPVDPGALASVRTPTTIGGRPAAAAAEEPEDAGAEDAPPDDVGALEDAGEETAVDAEPAASDAASDAGGDADAGAGAGSGEEGGAGEETGGGGGAAEEEDEQPQPTKIKHVFVVALQGQGYEATFGAGSPAAYLNGRLRPKGVLLENYASLGAADLPDHLAMIAGQPPNADTRAGCPTFREIPPSKAPSRAGVIAADGCVFPNTVTTLGDQLTASRRPWRAYVEDVEKGPGGRKTCRHPESNAADDTLRGRPGDGYATRRNPFVYFHSLLDLGDCDAKVGGLAGLERDLRAVGTTPAFSFVVPGLCDAGSESPCADGSPGGLAAADAFLARWVPKILASPAYRRDGLLIVAFAGGPAGDPAAAAAPDAPVRNGALLVSRFAQAGSTAGGRYDPHSLLRSVEDLFALRPLALAADARSFAPTVLGRAFAEPPGDG